MLFCEYLTRTQVPALPAIMTAAGMSMHMAMINARASANALNQKGSKEKSGSNSIRLTEREIESIRRESGRDNLQSTREENKTEFLRETKEHDKEILPKCSTCCTMM